MTKKKLITTICALTLSTGMLLAAAPKLIANAKYDAEDYFLFPDEVKKTAYLGERAEIARISPTEKKAENYSFAVVYTADGSAVETEGYSFLPERAGEYKCIYSYTVDGQRMEYSYLMNVTVKNAPVFSELPVFPNAFVSGCEYVVDEAVAAEYTGGQKEDVDVSVSATCNGAPLTITGDVICPVADVDGAEVRIVYTATGKSGASRIEKTIPVVRVYGESNTVNFAELFSHTGVSATATEECVQYVAYADATLPFANLLSENDASIKFGFGQNASAKKITLDIESYADPSVAVSLTFEKGMQNAGNGRMLLNGGNAKPYVFTENQIFEVKVDGKNNRLTDGLGQVLFEIDRDKNGGVFEGFTGGFIKLTLRVEEVYGACEVKVYQVNTQVLSNKTTEMVRPAYYYDDFIYEATLGETITVENIVALDVVDPNAAIATKVYFGGRQINFEPTANGGISFTPQDAGEYRVDFVVSDRSGNQRTYKEFISVYDKTKPVLTLSAALPEKFVVDGEVTLPGATATDNGGEDWITMRITVVYPSAQCRMLASATGGSIDGVKFTPTQKGTYRVYYYAGDEYNNYVLNEYQIVCEG